MTLQEIKDLKDKIYEIEGLLELAQLREDKIPELEPLILARINALNEKADASESSEVADEYSDNIEAAIEEEIEETQPELEEMEEFEEEEYDSEEKEVEQADEEQTAPVSYPQPTGVITELFEETDTVSVSREADDLEIPEIEEPAKVVRHNTNAAKPAFTLNDRFRFRRELFSNSDAEYSSAMDLIASMESYEEAEEYFLDELGWSLENPEVKDFMDIIQKYFA